MVGTSDNSKITISMEDLNKLIDAKIEQKINESKADLIPGNGGRILWKKTDTSTSFAAQTVTLNDSIENYDYVKVYAGGTESIAQEGIVINNKVNMILGYSYYANGWTGHPICYRYVRIADNKATFQGGYSSGSGSNNTSNNIYMIPYYIVGYKFAE